MRSMALSLMFGTVVSFAGCSAEPDLSTVRPLTYQDLQIHNNWVYQKNNEAKAAPFEGRPIQVSGVGRVKAAPNVAVITGQIKTEAPTDDVAVDMAAKLINDTQKRLDGQSAELNFMQILGTEKRDEDCQKHNVEAQNRYNEIVSDNQFNKRIKVQIERGTNTSSKPRQPKPRIRTKLCPVLNSEVRINFVARVPSGQASNVINMLTEAGAEDVNLFGYDFEDYDKLYKDAAAKAVMDARGKAELIAARAGTQLREITDFRVDPPNRVSRYGPQAMIITNHANRSVAPGRYNDSVDLLNSGAQYVTIPAVFETVNETVVAQEASTELVTIPATYETVRETVVVQEASTEIAIVNGRPVERVIPAVTKQETRRVVKTPARTAERTIPAVTKTLTRRIIKTPARAERVGPEYGSANNALKMSLAGNRTIKVQATLTYDYITPIDGTLPKAKAFK